MLCLIYDQLINGVKYIYMNHLDFKDLAVHHDADGGHLPLDAGFVHRSLLAVGRELGDNTSHHTVGLATHLSLQERN